MDAAVTQASKRIGELPKAAAELIASLIPDMLADDGMETAENLSRAGHKTGLEDPFGELVTNVSQAHSNALDDFRTLLDTISGLSSTAVDLSPRQRWRLPTLNRLLQALRFSTATHANDLHAGTRDLTSAWLRTAALAAGLDPDTLAAEARSCLLDASQDAFDLVRVRLPREDDFFSLERLDEHARAQLPVLLSGDSAWIADTATDILWGHTDPAWFSMVTTLIPHTSPPRQHRLAGLAISLSNDTATQAAAYFASSDPPLRYAAAAWLDDSDPLHDQALLDPDASVRHAAGAAANDQTIPPAQYWSCPQCAGQNEMSTLWCASCKQYGPFPPRIRLSSQGHGH